MTQALLCFECHAPATHRHHVVPKVLGGTQVVGLCDRCHELVHGFPEGQFAMMQDARSAKHRRGGYCGGQTVPCG